METISSIYGEMRSLGYVSAGYYDEPLAKHTTFRIGGPADVMVVPADARGLAGIISLCRETDTPCYLIALTLSVLWNFTLNREFTFKSANNIPVAMAKVAAFYCVFTPLSTWWGSALTGAGFNEYIVLFGTMAVNLTSEFLYDRFFVFRGTMNTNKRAQKETA